MTEFTVPRPVTVADFLARDSHSDDDTLKIVRNTRMALMDKLMESGLPTDSDGFELLHKNLVELDKTALKSKSLQIDQSNAEANAKMAAAAANEYFKSVGSGNDPFVTDEDETDIPDPMSRIAGTGVPVPGELKVGDDTQSYDEFMKNSGDHIAERVRSGELALKDL